MVRYWQKTIIVSYSDKLILYLVTNDLVAISFHIFVDTKQIKLPKSGAHTASYYV